MAVEGAGRVVGVDASAAQIPEAEAGRPPPTPGRRGAAPAGGRLVRRGGDLPGAGARGRPRRRPRRGGPGPAARWPVRDVREPPAVPDARAAAGSTTRSSTRPSSTGGSGPTCPSRCRSRRSTPGCGCPSSTARSAATSTPSPTGACTSTAWSSRRPRRGSWPGPAVRGRRHHPPAPGPEGRAALTVARSQMEQFVVITGLSGAGRSLAADDLEDLGWFVIDNLPPELVPKVVELAQAPGSQVQRVALVVGTGHYQDEIMPTLAWLRSTGARVRVLFLDASTDTLVRRYESTRRRHPLSGGDGPELPGAGHRARAAAARAGEGRGRRRRRHQRPQRARAAAAHARPVRRRRVRPPRCRPRCCRSATRTACPSTPTWCSTAGSCPTRTGSTSCAR